MARPKTNPEKHRQNVAITLDPALLRQARELAASDGKSLSQVIENELRGWIMGKIVEQSYPSARHLTVIKDTGFGLKAENISTDLSANIGGGVSEEDPFVTQAQIAAQNTRSRDEARKSEELKKESKSVAAQPLRKRRRLIDMEPETSSVTPLVKLKRKRIIE